MDIDEYGRVKRWQFAIRLYSALSFGFVGKYFVQIKLPKGSLLIGFFKHYIDLPFFIKV